MGFCYHVMLLARNGTIPDKTSCWSTGFIKSTDYLFLTGLSFNKNFSLISDDDQIPGGNI